MACVDFEDMLPRDRCLARKIRTAGIVLYNSTFGSIIAVQYSRILPAQYNKNSENADLAPR